MRDFDPRSSPKDYQRLSSNIRKIPTEPEPPLSLNLEIRDGGKSF